MAREEKLIITNNTVKFMKKYLFSALAMGLMLTSCQSDEPFAPGEGGEKQVTFTLNVPCELGTRATTGNNSELGGFSNNQGVTRYYTLVLEANGDTQILKQSNATTTATFTPTVVLGRNYTITAYASLDDNGSIDEKADIEAISVQKNFNDETKDAYFHTTTHNFANGDLETLSLKRPFGKLRLLATDYNVTDNAKPITDVKSVTIEYISEIPNQFDAVDGIFDNKVQIAAYTYAWTKNGSNYENYYSMTDGAMPLFADYIPANGGDNPTSFKVTVTYGNNETYSRIFNDIPVKRNALTTLKGAFFTAGAEITVEVDDAFDNSEAVNKSFVSTASQLQEAINNATPGETTEIILDGNIDLTQPIVFGAPPVSPAPAQTRSEEATAGNYVLNLNGKAIVGRVPKSVGHVIEIRPGATLKVIGGEISSTAANGGSAIYNEGILEVDGTTIVGASVRENEGWPSYPINNYSNMTLKNVTITGYQGAIACNSAGTTTLENCTINKEYLNTSSHVFYINNADANVVVNSGTYTHKGMDGSLAYVNKGSITVNGGTFSASNGGYGMAALANGSITVNDGTFEAGFIDWGGNITLKGGEFAAKPDDKWISEEKAFAQNVNGKWEVVNAVAKVGSKGYATIDDAIANWTHNTTLTLLNDVELSDVVTLKSTEHHTLNLGTYTMTAASGKNAFVIKACGNGSAERTAITINADASNPGGINAGNKCIVYYKYADGGITTEDRPIIKINGGVFTGSTNAWGTAGIYTIGTAARKCATLNISGGTFNCSINGSGKSKLLISGGTFNYSVGSQGDSTALRLIWGGKFKTLGFMTADSNNTKFWFGTSMGNSNVGLYIDDNNYLVVGGPVITEFGDKFAAKATNYSEWSSYLKYSSAATYGLYYTNADMAIAKHGAANVEAKQ